MRPTFHSCWHSLNTTKEIYFRGRCCGLCGIQVINIHPPSGWFFIFGYNPNLYWQGTSALILTCRPCICYLLTRKRVPWVKYTYLVCFFIIPQLIYYVFLYRLSVFTHGIYVISLTPKFAIAVRKFHVPPFLEYHQATFPFQIPHESRNAHFGRDAYIHVYMIRTYFSLYDLRPFPLAQFP